MRSRHWGHKPLCRVAFSVPTIGASSPFLSGAHRSVFCAFAASQRLLCICCIAAASVHLLHCSVFCASAASQRLLRSGKLFRSDFRFAPSLPQRFGQQHLPDGSPPQRPRPATNLIRRRRSSVWLAIWRTWAGFANSQHRDAALAIPNNICAHSSLLPHRNCCSDRRKSFDPSAPIAYATSVSPPNEAVAWPRRRCWMANAAAGCRWRSSCKSPRARILVLGTSGAHWPARWPRFVLTERVAKS